MKNDNELEKRNIHAALKRLDSLLASLPSDENSNRGKGGGTILDALKELEVKLDYQKTKWLSEIQMSNMAREKLQRQVRDLKLKVK